MARYFRASQMQLIVLIGLCAGCESGPVKSTKCSEKQKTYDREVAREVEVESSSREYDEMKKDEPDLGRPMAAPPPKAANGHSTGPRSIRVFFATDRPWTGATTSPKFYANARRSPDDDSMDLGWCYVSIPEKHKVGEIERPRIWRFEFYDDPAKHFVLADAVRKNAPQFYAELHRDIEMTQEKQALLYIHGFNNSFEDAAWRTAQIVHDLNFDGAPVMYSWPSQGKPSPSAYMTDEDSVQLSRDHLAQFLLDLRAKSGAKVIHVIAHSMGARALSYAVEKLPDSAAWPSKPLLNQIILAAPDINQTIFRRDIAPRIKAVSDRLTIYASSCDAIIALSSEARSDIPRLGDARSGLTAFSTDSNIELVDVSKIDTSLLGHDCFAECELLLGDILCVLRGIKADNDSRKLEQFEGCYRLMQRP